MKAQALENLGAGLFNAPRALQDMDIEDDQSVLALVDERARVLVGRSLHTTQPFEDAVLQLVAGGYIQGKAKFAEVSIFRYMHAHTMVLFIK